VVTKDELFGQVLEYPDPVAAKRLSALVGIEDIIGQVIDEAVLLLDPEIVRRWSEKHHGCLLRAADEVTKRTPLLVFTGDVGTGKTELAETFGDAVARKMKLPVTLYPLSLSARGTGAVGEMTTLLTAAFSEVRQAARSAIDSQGRARRGTVLLIDEGDALAQSRDLAQMHHEDRAGVNALIRGLDQLRSDRLPVLTVLCTNREEALDPALTRRAARLFRFERPSDEQRRVLLGQLLDGCAVSSPELDKLVAITGTNGSRTHGCTYSDIRQRLVPEAVLEAVANDVPLSADMVIARAERLEPTRPFGAQS
jgi:AAA+ superfamily predicted ATPase